MHMEKQCYIQETYNSTDDFVLFSTFIITYTNWGMPTADETTLYQNENCKINRIKQIF